LILEIRVEYKSADCHSARIASRARSLAVELASDQVQSVAFSPDGKPITSASQDGAVKVWDAMTGQETLTLNGHVGRVWSVAFSPDGQWIASAGQDRSVKLWDARPLGVEQANTATKPTNSKAPPIGRTSQPTNRSDANIQKKSP
jgi:WD40 repeat protein